MNTQVLIAIGLEALYQWQKRQVFTLNGHWLTRNEFMHSGFPTVLNPIAVLLCARAGINLVQIDAPAAPAQTNGMEKRIQLVR